MVLWLSEDNAPPAEMLHY